MRVRAAAAFDEERLSPSPMAEAALLMARTASGGCWSRSSLRPLAKAARSVSPMTSSARLTLASVLLPQC